VLDLSCVFSSKNNFNEFCIILINKFKKYSFDYVQKNLNTLDFYKNEEYCQIEIIQLSSKEKYNYNNNNHAKINEEINKSLFYLKIVKKKGNNLQKVLSNLIFSFK
jgi:uncharacterized protein YcgL (UPF0745 family)